MQRPTEKSNAFRKALTTELLEKTNKANRKMVEWDKMAWYGS